MVVSASMFHVEIKKTANAMRSGLENQEQQ